MPFPYLVVAVLIAVLAFLTWERHAKARARIESELRRVGATPLAVTLDWRNSDLYTATYNVTYASAMGHVARTSCKIGMRLDADPRIYWADPLQTRGDA